MADSGVELQDFVAELLEVGLEVVAVGGGLTGRDGEVGDKDGVVGLLLEEDDLALGRGEGLGRCECGFDEGLADHAQKINGIC